MAKVSPAQRTLRLLKKEGGYPEVVEKFIKPPFKRFGFRRDLWNFVDILSSNPLKGEILFVQVCNMASLPAHRVKCFTNENLKHLLDAGGIFELHGWRKLKMKNTDGKKGKCEKWECYRERYTSSSEIPEIKPSV